MNWDFSAVRGSIEIAGRQFPMYAGFISPMHVDMYASVPNFSKDGDTNLTIAERLPTANDDDPPTRWQRPSEQVKINKIRGLVGRNATLVEGFDVHEAEIIPNPILLAVNDSFIGTEGFMVRADGIDDHRDEFRQIRLSRPDESEHKPLWIVDGQHRNLGLKEVDMISAQPHPVVLLLDDDGQAYPHAMIAKIFGQVTTNATPLDPEHDEWLQYCFNQGRYSGEGATPRRYAMRTLLRMCTVQVVPEKETNNSTFFRGRIPFHPKNRMASGNSTKLAKDQAGFKGFSYSLCEPNVTERGGAGAETNWIELLQKHLYQRPEIELPPETPPNNEEQGGGQGGAFQHTPERCADAIIAAIAALHSLDSGKDGGSHFFTDEYKIPLVNEWFKQLLHFVARTPDALGWNQTQWQKFLRQRHFETDWGVFGPIGAANEVTMRIVCKRVFKHLFNAEDPADEHGRVTVDSSFDVDTMTLPEWMAGAGIKIRVRVRKIDPMGGRPAAGDALRAKNIQSFGLESTLSKPRGIQPMHDGVEFLCQSMNVVIDKICSGTNQEKIGRNGDPHRYGQLHLGGAGASLSSKKAQVVTPRQGADPYFRIYYSAYMRTGSHNVNKQ